jgi:hypothetical protein
MAAFERPSATRASTSRSRGLSRARGSLVLTDTLHDTFTTLVGNVYQRIDFEVRGGAALSSGGTAVRDPIPESILSRVRRVPGVADADPAVTGYAQYVPTAVPSATEEHRQPASPSTPTPSSPPSTWSWGEHHGAG